MIVSEEALEDIQAIFHYISEVECLPITAQRWVDSVENAIKSLNYMPHRYPKYDLQFSEISELRKLVVNTHLVLYTVEDTKRLVSVIRVISTRQSRVFPKAVSSSKI